MILANTGGVQGIFTLALVSPSVGLITDEVIRTLIQFARNVLGGIKGVSPKEERPSITSKSPEDGSENVILTTTITATFSDPVDRRTVKPHSFRLSTINNSNNIVEITGTNVDLSTDGKTAKLTPPTLAASTTYIVTVTTEAKDLGGHELEEDERWSFKTVP